MARNRTPVETLKAPLLKRQPRESSICYETFVHYRDQGPKRSIASVSRELGKNVTMLEDRARRWRWIERVDVWDAHLEGLAIEAQEEEVRSMNQRHARLGPESLKLVLARITGDDERNIQAIDPNRRARKT
jgi:hypothetical protein